jgi:hypothetical protein
MRRLRRRSVTLTGRQRSTRSRTELNRQAVDGLESWNAAVAVGLARLDKLLAGLWEFAEAAMSLRWIGCLPSRNGGLSC